jgi:2-oxo-3-hexenedioate decarboxylase
MTVIDTRAIARDLEEAYARRTEVPPPSSTLGEAFAMTIAYGVEAEVMRARRSAGRVTVGRKVGFANKAMWRILKLDTLVWARMYDNTVHYSSKNEAALPRTAFYSPRIEPEIVFRLKRPLEAGLTDATAVLDAVEWMALGFEINDCMFPDWKFQPVDFVAAFGLHAALVVGDPQHITPEAIPALAERLPRFTLRLNRNETLVEEGSGKAALRSPALCLGELASAIARQPGAEPLEAGELISTGTLTTPQPIEAGDVWRADVDGIALPSLTLRLD